MYVSWYSPADKDFHIVQPCSGGVLNLQSHYAFVEAGKQGDVLLRVVLEQGTLLE